MFGHSGLLGEQVPLAVGACFVKKQMTLTIFGDAAIEEDYVAPALGWAVTQKLPIIFICEDNDLSVLTKTEDRRSWKALCSTWHSAGLSCLLRMRPEVHS